MIAAGIKISFDNGKVNGTFAKIRKQSFGIAVADMKIRIGSLFNKTGKGRNYGIFADRHSYTESQDSFLNPAFFYGVLGERTF